MEQEWSYDDDELIEMAELLKVFGDSTRILDLMDSASEGRSKTETLITRFSQKYTPCVVIAALILAVVPPLFTGFNFAPWIHRALNFLVVSCPCALVISVPLAFFGGIGGVSKAGMIAKGGVGSDAAVEASDLVLLKDDLRGLPRAIRIARRTIAIAKQNIVFALAVKFGVMALSIPGITNMWLAVFADVGVAILCILNSFRAMKAKD